MAAKFAAMPVAVAWPDWLGSVTIRCELLYIIGCRYFHLYTYCWLPIFFDRVIFRSRLIDFEDAAANSPSD
jgi:hypothetical protein